MVVDESCGVMLRGVGEAHGPASEFAAGNLLAHEDFLAGVAGVAGDRTVDGVDTGLGPSMTWRKEPE